MFKKWLEKGLNTTNLQTLLFIIFWGFLIGMTLILTHPAGNQKVWTHEGHQYFEIAQVDETTSIYESEPGMSIQIEEVVFVGLFRKLYFDYHKSYMYLVVSNGLVYTLQDALQQGIITEDQALNTVPDLKAVYLED